LRAASSAATCAAYGVDLREPLKPMVPADDQAIALPWTSVMVIIVLLKLAFTCATPELMFLRSRRRTRVASLPILDPFPRPACLKTPGRSIFRDPTRPLLLLPGDRPGRALARAGIGMGALPAHRQTAAVPQPAIAAKVHQPLDIELHLTPEVALHQVIAVDHLADV